MFEMRQSGLEEVENPSEYMLSGRPEPVSYTHLDVYKRQVRTSVTAYVEKDLELARSVMKADDEIDQYFEEVRDLSLIHICRHRRKKD